MASGQASEGAVEAPSELLAVLAQLQAADLAAMHLVGAVGEAQRARVRPPEASGNSWLTPPPPWSCMARSTTASVMLGTATLISAMACLAALLPTVSIM